MLTRFDKMRSTHFAWHLFYSRSDTTDDRSFSLKDVNSCATGDVDQLLGGESGDYLLLSGLLRYELMFHVNILFRFDVSEGQGLIPGETGSGIIELAIGQIPLQGILEAQCDG